MIDDGHSAWISNPGGTYGGRQSKQVQNSGNRTQKQAIKTLNVNQYLAVCTLSLSCSLSLSVSRYRYAPQADTGTPGLPNLSRPPGLLLSCQKPAAGEVEWRKEVFLLSCLSLSSLKREQRDLWEGRPWVCKHWSEARHWADSLHLSKNYSATEILDSCSFIYLFRPKGFSM